MAEMTKEELQDLIQNEVKDIVDEDFEEVKEQNEQRIKEMQKNFIESKKEQNEGKGNNAAKFLRALAAGKGDPEKAARHVKKNWGDEKFSKELLESDFDAGGVLVPDQYVAEIIDLLSAQSTVRAMGATTMPMSRGSMSIPKLTKGATSSYVGESEKGGSSQQEFGSIQMSAKKLKTLVPISNDLIRDSSPRADSIVRDDMVRSMALREDIAFIRDDGTENKPKGMYYWAASDNKFNVSDDSGSTTLDTVTNDLIKALFKLEGKDVPMTRVGWIFHPRTKYFLMKLRDGNGNYAFREEMQNGMLLGYPFMTTTQIPTNLDASTDGDDDESEIYLADFGQLIIADNTELIIDVSTEASFYDGSSQVSAFDNDLTLMRAIARHDFGSRYDEAISVIEAVDWSF